MHLSWNNFSTSVYVRGERRVHRVSSSPVVDIFGDAIENRTGIWIETDPASTIPDEICQLACIHVGLTTRNGKSFLEVASSSEEIRRQFYMFATSVADCVLTQAISPIDAVVRELACFIELLQVRSLLSLERQIGLLGELLFLRRLIEIHGEAVVEAWVGPLAEPHDFRIGKNEFEVKTTLATRRVHTINGESQLLPSVGRSLYLLSVLLGPAGQGEGVSLSDAVQSVDDRLSGKPAMALKFRQALKACGFQDSDRQNYSRKFVLRRPIGLVAIDESVPALTRPRIKAAVGTASDRISDVQYDLDVEGLESLDGTPSFNEIISKLS